ncbi:MAG: DUF6481 family protein [Pseudomonadota bacterium]
MSSYKEPSFQERTAAAKKAKLAAVQGLREKSPIDEAVLRERSQAAEARQRIQEKKREEKRAARELEKDEKRQRDLQRAEPEPAIIAKTEDERKIERDAKYAARKSRKGKK